MSRSASVPGPATAIARRMPRIGAVNARLLVLLAVLIAGFGALIGPLLFAADTLRSMALQVPSLGLLSLAMMVALLSGGLDLSIIAVADFSALVSAFLLHHLVPPHPGALAIPRELVSLAGGLLVAVLIGALNGAVIAFLDVSPILTTLGTMTMVNGLSIGVTHGGVISGFPPLVLFLGNGSVLGVPAPLIVFALTAVPVSVVLNRSPFGRLTAMIGSNEAAVRYSGVDTRRALVGVYVLSGLLAGLAGVLMMARFNSANASYGQSYLLVSVLAAVLGGVDPLGGFGRVGGVVIALAILQLISTAFNLLGFNEFLTLTIWGATLVSIAGAALIRRAVGRLSRHGRESR